MLKRKIAPSFVKSASFLLPSPITIQLPNGISLHSIEGVQQDIIKVEFIFKAGKWFEPKIGLSHFTAQMIERGTAEKTSSQLAEFFDQYGAHIEISPGLDFTSIALYTLSKNLHHVLPAFLEMLKTPSFPESELRQMKEVFIQNLKVNNEKNSFLASKALRRNIFGSDHPYGSSIEQEDVNNLKRADLLQYFAGYIVPSEIFVVSKGENATIDYIIKNVSVSHLMSKSRDKITPVQLSNPFFQKINKANSVQSSIRLGKKTITRNHPDYFDLLFLNHILGGYFGSRLMKNIREEKGLTYGIQSSLNSLVYESYLAIGADVNKENEDIIFQEIKNELIQLQTNKIGDNELEAAKGHFSGSIQSEIANPFSVAEKIKTIKLFSLPDNYYQTLLEKVYSITPSQLLDTAQSYLNDCDFFKVAAG
ncbi:MAG: pitrilysin family protein [Bacteroidota bacterium]